jgi:hypothetical protein
MIDHEIPQSNFEFVRDKIYEILLAETNNQVVSFYNTKCSGVKFFADRTVPIQKEESVTINISLFKGKFDELQTVGRQDGDIEYLITIMTNKPSTPNKRGDESAAKLLHQWIGIIRYILMSPQYLTLNMPDGIVGHTEVSEIHIDADFEKQIDSSNNSVGYLILVVSLMEESLSNEGRLFAQNKTNVYIDSTDRGYEYKLIAH